DIFDWLSKYGHQVVSRAGGPLRFVNQLQMLAQVYREAICCKDRLGNEAIELQNIRYLMRNARQHLVVLLAAAQLDSAEFRDVCRELEKTMVLWRGAGLMSKHWESRLATFAEILRTQG